MKQITKSVFLITLLLNSIFAIAQENDTLEIQKNEKGKVKFARFHVNASSNRKMQNDTVFLKSILHAKNEDGFRKTKEDLDELGITHKKFQQYYKGLKVENSEFLIHGKDGNIEVINGDFQDINAPIITPTINEKQALNKALVFVGSKKYKWEDIAMEKFVKQNTNNPNASYYPKGELVISKDYLNGSHSWKLSWKFTISSIEPNNEQLIYVDANDGSIINNTPLISDANVSCTSQTRYSGTQNIVGDSFIGGNRLQENRNGVSIQTLNLNSTYNYASAVDFVNSSTSWTASSWINFNTDQAALDAHWGAEKVFDFWGTVFTRNSINGAGIRVLSYVHAGSNWGNAQWVGGSNSNYMQYGDGNSTFNPLVSLDISAHEFGHGITQFTANLTPGTQESGALNEGFSDIWGACVEHWAAPYKQTWLIGEEIFKTSTFNCIRNLQNPKSLTTAEGQHPDTYHGNFWDNNGEPHFNSTILSHWFYLLSQGGSGTNDLGNSFYVGGISIENAQKIAYRAEALYLNSSADYSAARNATIQAATDLASSIPNAIIETTNAWYAVGVGNQYQYSFSGPSYVCPSSIATFTINNPPSNYSWGHSTNLTPISGSSGSFTTSFWGGNAWVSINVNGSEIARKNFIIGSQITGVEQIVYVQTNRYYADPACSNQNNIWVLSWQGMNILTEKPDTVYGKNYVDVVSSTSSNYMTTYDLSLIQDNGYKPIKYISVNGVKLRLVGIKKPNPFPPIELLLYPNPVADILSVEIKTDDTDSDNATLARNTNTNIKSYTIQLWNERQGLMRTIEITESIQQISLQGLPNGMYFVHVIKNGKMLQRKIIWKN